MIFIIGICLGLYTFAEGVIDNNETKNKLKPYINRINIQLINYKDEKSKNVLSNLLKLSYKIFIYSLIILLVIFLLPEKIQKNLIQLFIPVFIISCLLIFSISLIQYHNRTFKNYFLKGAFLPFILFSPTIFYLIDFFNFSKTKLIEIFNPLIYVFKLEDNIFLLQVIWFFLFILLYIIVLSIAFIIYFLLYAIITLTIYYLRIFYRHINKNLVKVIIYTIAFLFYIYGEITK